MAAESIVSAILPVIRDKLISPAIPQICLAYDYDDKLQKLKRNLESIQSVLVDAEKRQTAETSIKDWLSHLKNVSYEAEDLLEEFEFEAQRTQWSLYQDNLKRMVLFCCSFPNRIVTRFILCRRLNKIIEKIEDIANEIQRFNFHHNGLPQISYCRPPTHSYVDKENVLGREKDKEDIVSFLINHDVSNNKKIVVIPIVAMGGMGKTTLSQLVYRDHRVEDYFCLRIWVCVSDADFDVVRLVRLIIEAATKSKCKLSNMELLQKRLREIISEKRYLIILDDVWNEDPIQWEGLTTLLSDCGREGSSVVVSTRSEVAAKMMATQTIHYLKCLPEEDSWELFRRKAFAEGAEEPASLVKIGKNIIKRCGGLPLAISTLGSMMHLKNDENQWKAVLDSELWEMKAAKDNILPALRLSYSHLSPHLKQCFAFCAIYPKDYTMDKDTLIQLWMANEFIPSEGKGDLETIGKDIFDELVWRSFFQDVFDQDNGEVSCKMHNLIHDLAQSIMGKECLNFAHAPKLEDVPSTTKHLCIPNFRELNSSLNKPILLPIGKILESNLPSNQPVPPRIRTLFGSNLPINDASKFKSLRVLSLSNTNLNQNTSISQLIHLRLLDLSYTKIKELPKDICSLYNLQTLKLFGCYDLEMLPDNLANLVKLRHLDISECEKLECMPIRMGRLKQLHTLTNYIVSAEAERGIEQLRDLNLGGRLLLCGLEKVSNAMDAEDASLSSKQNLHSIDLDWGGAGSLDVFEALKPHSGIKILNVSKYGGQQFPAWMNVPQQLQNLVKILLFKCSECQELPSLGKLPYLKELLLYQLDNVKHIISKKTWSDIQLRTTLFPSLKRLELNSMKNLEDWWETEGSNTPVLPDRQFLPSLTILWIFWCNKLTIRDISSIEELTLVSPSRNLNLTSFFSLTSTSDEAPRHSQLRHLRLDRAHNLVHFTASFPFLRRLELRSCDSLESLPGPGSLTKLYSLSLYGCHRLASLPQGMEDLTYLYIFSCNGLMSLPEDLLKLNTLRLSNCNGLVSLPKGMEDLTKLSISDCNGLMSLPEDLLKLEKLKLSKCNGLVSLLEKMEGLTQLKVLKISECDRLRSLPEGLLRRLPTLWSLQIIGHEELIMPFQFGGEYLSLIEKIPKKVIKQHEHRQESSPSTPSTSKCSCLGQSL